MDANIENQEAVADPDAVQLKTEESSSPTKENDSSSSSSSSSSSPSATPLINKKQSDVEPSAPPQADMNQQGGDYPPPQVGQPAPPGGYPPPQGGYPPPQGGYPPPQGGYPPPQGGYPPPQDGNYQSDSQKQPLLQQQQAEPVQPWQPDASASFKWEGVADGTSDMQPDNAFSLIGGYEHVNFDGGPAIPPPPYEPPAEENKPEEVFTSPDALTEEEVRQAMLDFVSGHCCYGSKPAKEMEFSKITPSSALHYILETFTEGRTTRRQHEPFHGGFVDGPQCGMAPGPWDMLCSPTSLFNTHKKYMEVPHTAQVKICFRCTGRGFLRCTTCGGDGRVRCTSCSGSGTREVTEEGETGEGETRQENCFSCSGCGTTSCSRCGGDGRITCHECKGFRSLRHFIQLVVEFTNNKDDYILEGTDMPDELIRDVSGQVIFEQTLPYIWPITCYPVQQINENSVRIVNQHQSSWQDQRKLQQRQVLRSVPVSEVNYSWKDNNDRFWVYGYEHEVHAPDYPHQCCWGCTLL